jgi:hypothetical protein
MKQVLQNLKNDDTKLVSIPPLLLSRGFVNLSVERMLVDFGKSNSIQKARQQTIILSRLLIR